MSLWQLNTRQDSKAILFESSTSALKRKAPSLLDLNQPFLFHQYLSSWTTCASWSCARMLREQNSRYH